MNDSLISHYTTSNVLERIRYFPRQLITAGDMCAEQEYFREKLRCHNRMLHGWGVVCGCAVTAPQSGDPPWQVKVSKGYVITPGGDEICIPDGVTFDLAGDWRRAYDPCPQPTPCSPASGTTASEGATIYLAVCYTECNARPVRIHPAGCGCDEAACEYSRIREGFELVRLDNPPNSHAQAEQADTEWENMLGSYLRGAADGPLPLPQCPPDTDDCRVVLAKITLPGTRSDPIQEIDNDVSRRCFSTGALAVLIQAHVRPIT